LPVGLPVILTPAARADIIAAQDWYEARSIGLGGRFRAELTNVVERLADNALHYPLVFRDVHRALVHRFPYALFFVVGQDAVTVIACFHASRDPQQWQRRVDD
jgi:toxin ParE1/3/4